MKKPRVPLDLSELPPPPSKDIIAFLPAVENQSLYPAESCYDDPPADAPVTPPKDSGFITMVEWPLRPGDTRIEAYFIGTNRARSWWFLWQFTVNDLVPFTPKYLEERIIVKMKRQKLSKTDSAILMVKCAWEYERDIAFFRVLCSCRTLASSVRQPATQSPIWFGGAIKIESVRVGIRSIAPYGICGGSPLKSRRVATSRNFKSGFHSRAACQSYENNQSAS
jgi:hypothetical protein